MANLVVCCDGTWNTPDQKDEKESVVSPTNVVKIFNATLEGLPNDASTVIQRKYYHPGVGTEGNWWEKTAGGSVGAGLNKNIMSSYRWLCDQFNPDNDDKVFLFGFSRGAFTARSLAGMITSCGILNLKDLSEAESWKRIESCFEKGYRGKNTNWNAHKWPLLVNAEKSLIWFVGVWDTVGALGIPDNLSILNLLENPRENSFHDTKISKKIKHARHAVALDESRASFTPTLWTDYEEDQNVKQVWFPGVHCDVGGGYLENGLSDRALKWMITEAKECGLKFCSKMTDQIIPNFHGVIHESRTGVFKYLRTQPRSIPFLDKDDTSNELVDMSAIARMRNPPISQSPYRTTIAIKAGQSLDGINVFASAHWNQTNVYLEKNNIYKFEAQGEWIDSSIRCTPDGPVEGEFQPGELAQALGTAFGWLEGIYKGITKNRSADFALSKRVEKQPWFSLIGTVANGIHPKNDGTPPEHEVFLIGSGVTYTPKESGYLYCFANDAWSHYGNNKGKVTMSITKS